MQPQPASSLSVRTSCSYRGDEETGWERESERGIKMADDIIYNNNNRQLTNIEFAACTMTSIEESSFCPVLFDLQLTEYRGRRAFWVGWVTSQILRVHRPKHPKKYVHQVLQTVLYTHLFDSSRCSRNDNDLSASFGIQKTDLLTISQPNNQLDSNPLDYMWTWQVALHLYWPVVLHSTRST